MVNNIALASIVGGRMSQGHLPSRRRVCFGLPIVAAGLATGLATAQAREDVAKADLIVVVKSARKLMLLCAGRRLGTFPIALGARPIGPKRAEGDARTPEGLYWIDGLNPYSRFYRALHLSYPNEEDVQQAHAAGVSPGGNIEIHALPAGYAHYDPPAFREDWTDGCIAVSNRAMDAIWARVDLGTAVEILA